MCRYRTGTLLAGWHNRNYCRYRFDVDGVDAHLPTKADQVGFLVLRNVHIKVSAGISAYSEIHELSGLHSFHHKLPG